MSGWVTWQLPINITVSSLAISVEGQFVLTPMAFVQETVMNLDLQINTLHILPEVRVHFWTPIGAASKLLSYALKYEKQRGAKMAIAFADTDAGEYGTVYQATNWICLGRQRHTSYQYVKNNKVIDSRSISQKSRQKGVSIKFYETMLEKNGWMRQATNAKHRYIYILTDESEKGAIYDRIKNKITEYPKRASVVQQ